MAVEIPEIKEMIDCAKRFLADKTTIHELHGWAQRCKFAAELHSKNSAIYDFANEWVIMTYRYWNEWCDVEEPLSEEEFRDWLKEQIDVF